MEMYGTWTLNELEMKIFQMKGMHIQAFTHNIEVLMSWGPFPKSRTLIDDH